MILTIFILSGIAIILLILTRGNFCDRYNKIMNTIDRFGDSISGEYKPRENRNRIFIPYGIINIILFFFIIMTLGVIIGILCRCYSYRHCLISQSTERQYDPSDYRYDPSLRQR